MWQSRYQEKTLKKTRMEGQDAILPAIETPNTTRRKRAHSSTPPHTHTHSHTHTHTHTGTPFNQMKHLPLGVSLVRQPPATSTQRQPNVNPSSSKPTSFNLVLPLGGRQLPHSLQPNLKSSSSKRTNFNWVLPPGSRQPRQPL